MSTDYDVRCIDCGCKAGFHDCRDVDLMVMLAEQGPTVQRMCIALESLGASAMGVSRSKKNAYIYFEPAIYAQDSHNPRLRFSTAWWREHGSHRLQAFDEYGNPVEAQT